MLLLCCWISCWSSVVSINAKVSFSDFLIFPCQSLLWRKKVSVRRFANYLWWNRNVNVGSWNQLWYFSKRSSIVCSRCAKTQFCHSAEAFVISATIKLNRPNFFNTKQDLMTWNWKRDENLVILRCSSARVLNSESSLTSLKRKWNEEFNEERRN